MFSLLRNTIGPFWDTGSAAGALCPISDRLVRPRSPRRGRYLYGLVDSAIDGRALIPAGLASELELVKVVLEQPAIALVPSRPKIKASRFARAGRGLDVYRNGNLLGFNSCRPHERGESEIRCSYRFEPEKICSVAPPLGTSWRRDDRAVLRLSSAASA